MSQDELERQVILWREAAKSRLAAAINFERERAEQEKRADRAEEQRDAVSMTAERMTFYARRAEAKVSEYRAAAWRAEAKLDKIRELAMGKFGDSHIPVSSVPVSAILDVLEADLDAE